MTPSPGERIKELRLLAEMSQDELGRRVGVQRAAINKYEKGIVENIKLRIFFTPYHFYNITHCSI